ncbi:acyltransferase [Buttiauxella agrestis]
MKVRDYSIDLLRTVCCFLVVGIHVTPYYNQYLLQSVSETQKIIALLIQSVVRVGLPVFFVISGMYILNCNISSVTDFYRKRVSSLIIPFIIYAFLHSVIYMTVAGMPITPKTVLDIIEQMKSSTGISPHFWFVYSMLGIYLVSPAFNVFIKGLSERDSIIALVVILTSSGYMQYLGGAVPGFSLPTLGVWMSYFVIGGLISKIENYKKLLMLCLLIASFIFTAFCIYLQFNVFKSSNLAPYDGGLNMMLFTISLCLFFKKIKIQPGTVICKIIELVSPRTYGIYLIHIAILTTLAHYIDFSWYIGNILTYSVLMSATTFFISLIISYAVDKLLCTTILKLINS